MEFKKGNNAIELEDKEAGLIVANASSGYKKMVFLMFGPRDLLIIK